MTKVVDFEDTEFAKDVITSNEKIVFNKQHRDNSNNEVTNTSKRSARAVKVKKYTDFTFELFGDTIDVCFHDMVHSDEDPNHWIFGNSNYAEQVINLSIKKPSGKALSPAQIKQTFVHECVHIMLESGQFYEESYNEALVEWMAKCINQMFFMNKDLANRF